MLSLTFAKHSSFSPLQRPQTMLDVITYREWVTANLAKAFKRILAIPFNHESNVVKTVKAS